MTIGGGVHLSVIVDRRGGSTLYDASSSLRCRLRCEAQHDRATPLVDQSRSVAALKGTAAGYIQDASYRKLREARVGFALPTRIARIGGASSASITVTGRNLVTWTPYKGLDPETVSASYDSIAASDNFYQPTLCSFTARLDVSW